MGIFEAVPNVSCWERARVELLEQVLARSGVLLADTHTDEDHGRTVFTMFGAGRELIDGLVLLAQAAVEGDALAKHSGVHPRTGIVDVVPIVPMKAAGLNNAQRVAQELGSALWSAGLPAAQYGVGAALRRTADARRAGSALAITQHAASSGGLFGHTLCEADVRRVDEIGVTLVGARNVLVACNLWFLLPDAGQGDEVLQAVQSIAGALRETGGGLPGVRALGFRLPSARAVQLSMNIEQPNECSPKLLIDKIDAEIARLALGAALLTIDRFELVGLAPQAWLDELVTDCAAREVDLVASPRPIEHWVEQYTRMRRPNV